MSKIWKIYGEQPSLNEGPEHILKHYASLLSVDTGQVFRGLVTEAVKEETGEVSYALYVVVPALRDYMYRLIEVNVANLVSPYPLEVKLFAKDPVNHRAFTCNGPSDFRTKLEELIGSPVTAGILMHLKTLIQINQRDDY